MDQFENVALDRLPDCRKFLLKPSVKEVRSKRKRKKTWLLPGKLYKNCVFVSDIGDKNTLLQQEESAISKFLQNQKYFPRHSWDISPVIRNRKMISTLKVKNCANHCYQSPRQTSRLNEDALCSNEWIGRTQKYHVFETNLIWCLKEMKIPAIPQDPNQLQRL